MCGRQNGEESQSLPKPLVRIGGVSRFAENVLLFWLVVLSIPGMLFAQQTEQPSSITLQQAVNIALEKNPEHKVALADTKAASADVKEARSFLLPHVAFSETATRGNDPVYVFGSKLRQQRFTTADFALNALNTPAPFGNFATRFGGTWNLFDSFGSWRAINRAERVKDAAGHQLERTDQEIIFHVVDSYYGVLLAKKQLEIAEASMKTAQAIQNRSKDRFESGVVVESDLLSAQVRVAIRKQEFIRAQNNLALARAQLGTSIGISTENDFEPGEALEERNLPAMTLEEAEKKAVELRPDLKRIRSEEAAQQQSVSVVKSSFGPRVNAFAGWEADNPRRSSSISRAAIRVFDSSINRRECSRWMASTPMSCSSSSCCRHRTVRIGEPCATRLLSITARKPFRSIVRMPTKRCL
jgi:outer membrane protein TolC